VKDDSFQISVKSKTFGSKATDPTKNKDSTSHADFGGVSVVPSYTEADMSGQQVILSPGNRNQMMRVTYIMDRPGSNLPEQKLNWTLYMKDGVTYGNIAGQKVKMTQPDGMMMGGLTTDGTQNLLDIPENMVSNLTVSKGEGDTVYSFALKPDQSMEYLKKVLVNVELMLKTPQGTGGITKLDVIVTAGQDNIVKTIKMDGTLKADIMNITCQINVAYSNVNTGQKITFPDLSQYKE